MDSVTTKRAVATAKKCHQRCRYSGETHVRTWKNRRHEGVDRKPKKDVTKYCRHRTVVRRVPCGEIAPLRNTRGVDDVKRGRTGSFVFSCRMHRLQGQQCRIGRCTHTHLLIPACLLHAFALWFMHAHAKLTASCGGTTSKKLTATRGNTKTVTKRRHYVHS